MRIFALEFPLNGHEVCTNHQFFTLGRHRIYSSGYVAQPSHDPSRPCAADQRCALCIIFTQ